MKKQAIFNKLRQNSEEESARPAKKFRGGGGQVPGRGGFIGGGLTFKGGGMTSYVLCPPPQMKTLGSDRQNTGNDRQNTGSD